MGDEAKVQILVAFMMSCLTFIRTYIMCITQGISEPSLRYVACRISHEVCTILGDKAMEFKKPFFIRCIMTLECTG